ncbi:MAG TPA: hypothetical protein VJX69_05730 [Terriglobales bacterium]|nr:hypothetical protein [Terriglobales bacterium]
MNFSSAWLFLLAAAPLLQASENTGIKMTIQYGQGAYPSKHTIYMQGDRKRTEYQNSFGMKKADGSMQPVYGPHIASITRCDLGQAFELNLDTHEYTSAPYPPKPFTPEELKARGLDKPVTYAADQPTVRIETTTTDTGERKEIFGHVARHVITTRNHTPLEGTRSGPQESVTDGWYIDFSQRLPCDRKLPETGQAHSYLRAGGGKQPIDRPEFIAIGEPERGFALNILTTIKGTYTLPDGTIKQMNSKMEMQVTQFDEGPLDPALFEIPPGFKHVDHIERNPATMAYSSQPKSLWQRVKASVAGLLNR